MGLGDRMKKNYSKIGLNIKQARVTKGISQDRLSKLADLSLNTISNIESAESANPTIETLLKIAKSLNVPLEQLIK